MFVSYVVIGGLFSCSAWAVLQTETLGWTVAVTGDNVTLAWSLPENLKKAPYFTVSLFRSSHNNNETSIFLMTKEGHVTVTNYNYHNRTRYTGNITKNGRGLFSFTLTKVEKRDAGRFICKEGFIKYNNCGRSLVVLLKPSTPNISITSNPTVSGEPVILTCDSVSRSVPHDHPLNMTYSWRRNGRKVLHDDGVVNVRGSILTVHNITRKNKGDHYTCQAMEDRRVRSMWSRRIVLDVLYGPEQIKFDHDSDSMIPSEGNDVTCSADCNPPCNVTWSDGSGSVISSINKAVLEWPVEKSLCEPYKCVVSNQYDIIARVISIKIPPSILNCTFEPDTLAEEETSRLQCIVYGKPDPHVSVVHGGSVAVMKIDKPLRVNTYIYTYVIYKARCSDDGRYDVIASNNVAEKKSNNIHLYVECIRESSGRVLIPLAVVCSVVILVIAFVAAFFIRRQKRKNAEKYRVRENIEEDPGPCHPDSKALYATVKKTSKRKGKDVYATVQKNRKPPTAASSSENQALIKQEDVNELEGRLNNNCGEKNADGLTYADLDLSPPTLKDGQPIINSKEEPVLYEQIDFSRTPGPQLPEKIWETENRTP